MVREVMPLSEKQKKLLPVLLLVGLVWWGVARPGPEEIKATVKATVSAEDAVHQLADMYHAGNRNCSTIAAAQVEAVVDADRRTGGGLTDAGIDRMFAGIRNDCVKDPHEYGLRKP